MPQHEHKSWERAGDTHSASSSSGVNTTEMRLEGVWSEGSKLARVRAGEMPLGAVSGRVGASLKVGTTAGTGDFVLCVLLHLDCALLLHQYLPACDAHPACKLL